MTDDLDDFFNEVTAAEEEAKKQEVKPYGSENKEAKKDASTSEGAATISRATEGLANDKEVEERPAKKTKLSPVRGVVVASNKVVVAASSSSLNVAKSSSDTHPSDATVGVEPSTAQEGTTMIGVAAAPPPPPPPPPPLPPGPPPSQQRQSVGSTIGPTAGPYMQPPPPPLPDAVHQKPHRRKAAGQAWVDPTLSAFPPDDYRLFIGNLAKDIRLDQLSAAFAKYPSFAMAKIMVNKHDGKSRGYGFVSLMDPKDCARAIREMDQSWLGSRPIKVRRSEWKDREENTVRKRERKEKKKWR